MRWAARFPSQRDGPFCRFIPNLESCFAVLDFLYDSFSIITQSVSHLSVIGGGWGAVSLSLKGLRSMDGAVTTVRETHTAPDFEHRLYAGSYGYASATLPLNPQLETQDFARITWRP